ncbi:hypothetical protein [Streptacidiphilus jiangxiensis]|uniref:hypothetical protein n=1 Tax=Streptacidiphilus jiangxiensis TaxID=235985 RepID=UPI001377FF00|nr:hypothetical protein [Streptacidiphilus jiangxiensis]
MAAILLRAFQERFHGGAAELGAFAERVQQGTGLAMTVSLQAFQDETQASLLAGADLAVELAEDLLAGRPAATRAAALGIRLPQDFTVLALQIGQDPEEAAASPGYRGTAAARKARRVRAALAAELPGPLLSAARPGHLLVLAPGPAERALLTRIHRRIARTVTAPLRVGAVWAARPADIPAAAANSAIEITRLATAFDLPEDAFQRPRRRGPDRKPGRLGSDGGLRPGQCESHGPSSSGRTHSGVVLGQGGPAVTGVGVQRHGGCGHQLGVDDQLGDAQFRSHLPDRRLGDHDRALLRAEHGGQLPPAGEADHCPHAQRGAEQSEHVACETRPDRDCQQSGRDEFLRFRVVAVQVSSHRSRPSDEHEKSSASRLPWATLAADQTLFPLLPAL